MSLWMARTNLQKWICWMGPVGILTNGVRVVNLLGPINRRVL